MITITSVKKQMVNAIVCTIELWMHLGGLLSTQEARVARGDSRVRLLSPGQTIVTCRHNISQHSWAQHVACVWPLCCDVLQHVGCCWLTQHVATRWPNARNMLRPTMLRYLVLACCGIYYNPGDYMVGDYM